MMSFNEWASKLEWASVRAKNEIDVPTEAVMVASEELAKAAIGTYDFGWPQLAESTQEQRVKLGYDANAPLLREGDLRSSIEHRTSLEPAGAVGVLGSNSEVALWQEMGTSRGIPPRPFLGGALIRAAGVIDETFGRWTARLISFR